jgi:hypothetical protein
MRRFTLRGVNVSDNAVETTARSNWCGRAEFRRLRRGADIFDPRSATRTFGGLDAVRLEFFPARINGGSDNTLILVAAPGTGIVSIYCCGIM